MINRFFRRNDIILLLAALLCAAALFLFTQNGHTTAGYADISHGGQWVHTVELNHAETWTWSDDGEFVSIEASASGVCVSASSCPDQLCVRQGFVTRDGQSLVCLPNKIVILLKANNPDGIDAVLY